MKVINVMYQTSFTKGQELVAQKLARELARQGCESYLVTSPYHDNEPIINPRTLTKSVKGYVWTGEEDKFGVPVIRVDGYVSTWPPRRIMFRDFVSILRRLYDELEYDIIITHSTLWNGPEDAAKFALWAKTLKSTGLLRKRIIFCHMSHYQPPDPLHYTIVEKSYRESWNRLVFPQIFRTADLLLCTTPLEGDDMIRLGARPEQIHIFPGGVDTEYIDNVKDMRKQLYEKLNLEKDEKLVSYVGTVETRKNPLAVVRTAKLLTDKLNIKFIIAGAPGNQHADVLRESKGLKNLIYVGRLEDDEKVNLMRISYLNIIMSRMEALGLTQLEFMYCGVPVITSAVGGQKWVVRNGVDGLHVNGPDDYRGAADAVIQLADNEGLREKMSVNAHERASKFSLKKLTKELITKLEELRRK